MYAPYCVGYELQWLASFTLDGVSVQGMAVAVEKKLAKGGCKVEVEEDNVLPPHLDASK